MRISCVFKLKSQTKYKIMSDHNGQDPRFVLQGGINIIKNYHTDWRSGILVIYKYITRYA